VLTREQRDELREHLKKCKPGDRLSSVGLVIPLLDTCDALEDEALGLSMRTETEWALEIKNATTEIIATKLLGIYESGYHFGVFQSDRLEQLAQLILKARAAGVEL
jgi:hypothetical protein